MISATTYPSLGGLALPVPPRAPESPTLIAFNRDLAAELGLGELVGDPDAQLRLFGGGVEAAAQGPVALAYAGHQFGHFVPSLGDGRAALLGEVTVNGRRYDIQLKGSGRTPFSRGGDGLSALGPVLREYLVSEAMHALGIPTTRALAAVATGGTVIRDGLQPGAVFTRVAASHLRVGTFEYFAARGDRDAVAALVDYAIDRHYPELADSSEPAVDLLRAVAGRQASLVADWMRVGFIHGVMNTDNTTLSGETIDYGPCAFMDEFRHDKVFSSIDRYGRYAYSNQAPIAQWNLARLADCLLLVSERREAFEEIVYGFTDRYEAQYMDAMRPKFGLLDPADGDAALVRDFLDLLEARELDYTQSFRALAGRVNAEDAVYGAWEQRWRRRLDGEGDPEQVITRMNAVNPVYIPRNHRIEEAIRAATDGDLSVFHALNRVLTRPFDEQPDAAGFAEPPHPAERVQHTFCGT